MGTYIIIPNNKEREKKLKIWFNKWKPFYNDFGQEHTFEDVFGEVLIDDIVRFKVGVMERRFYPKEDVEEIKELIIKFGGNPREE